MEAKATQNFFRGGYGEGGETGCLSFGIVFPVFKVILSKKLLNLKYGCTALINKLPSPPKKTTLTHSLLWLLQLQTGIFYSQALPSFKKSGMRRKGNNHELISTAIRRFRNTGSLVTVTTVILFYTTEK